ncbi:MAG: hypothetical protein JJE18_01760 [Eubacteriaceae bacterium]|nr:hypothetical protein [Eubacteriaceae bacterium]
MDKIKIIDSMPSTGKTCYIIEYIKELPDTQKVVYITPLLSETERIKKGCKGKRFCTPNVKLGKGSKHRNFKDLVIKGKNIATTHSLFKLLDEEAFKLIKEQNYILIMDEVVEVVQIIDLYTDYDEYSEDERQRICKNDIHTLIDKNLISIDSEYKLSWVDAEKSLNRYSQLKEIIELKEIYFSANTVLIELFPHRVFTENIFKEIIVMTYQLEYQLLSYYFEFFAIQYEKFGIIKHRVNGRTKYIYSLVNYDEYLKFDLEMRKKLKTKIHIVESENKNEIGKKDIGSRKEKLSVRYYKEIEESDIKKIKRKTNSFISEKLSNCTTKLMWTVFKNHIDDIKTTRMNENSFVPINARATNEYRDKIALIYLVNRFIHPYIEHLFSAKSISFDRDAYALSEMIQWIWRSAIRDNKPIDIYIPSERMRNLLIAWLNGEF